MQFAILGSGSRGNATLIRCGRTQILIDCGFSWPEASRRLQALDVDPHSIDALLVTHEHGDHAGGARRFAAESGCTLYATAGTARAAGLGPVTVFSPHAGFTIGEIEVQPFPVPHDAREPAQFVLRGGGFQLGILSDAGAVTPHMRAVLVGCDALLLEFNHCPELLQNGPYPPALKARVGGHLGHLSNAQSAELLGSLVHPKLGQVVLTHLSEKNNAPERALTAARGALAACGGEAGIDLVVAAQDETLDWKEIGLGA